MSDFIFQLSIPADEYLRLYQGSARDVVARAHDGRRVRFSAALLRQFVDRDGIHGQFRIVTDSNHKFQKIERLS